MTEPTAAKALARREGVACFPAGCRTEDLPSPILADLVDRLALSAPPIVCRDANRESTRMAFYPRSKGASESS
jgi:hypothetical protein